MNRGRKEERGRSEGGRERSIRGGRGGSGKVKQRKGSIREWRGGTGQEGGPKGRENI